MIEPSDLMQFQCVQNLYMFVHTMVVVDKTTCLGRKHGACAELN